MEKQPKVWTLGELAKVLEAEIVGPPDMLISAPATSLSDNSSGLAFAESEEFLEEARQSLVGAVIVPLSVEEFPKPILRHVSPRQAFGKLLHLFERPYPANPGIHPTAIVHPTAQIDPSVSVGAYVVIEADSMIEAGVNVMPFCYIGENSRIGEKSTLLPHVVLIRNVSIGRYCEIGPGAILGHTGFGYYWDGHQHVAIPQVGGVSIGDRVDIGALTAVDRATADDTTISEGNKLDNLVQVGHNVKIGRDGVIASQVGIAGSTRIGERLMAGGQAGFADHVVVSDGVVLAGRAGVMESLEQGGFYGGAPCVPIRQFHRITSITRDLPDIVKRIKTLEKKVEELEAEG